MNARAHTDGITNQWWLWFGMLGGAAAWALHLVLSYSLVPAACAAGLGYLLYLGIVGTGIIALAAVLVSWRALRLTRGMSEENGNGERLTVQRVRFMALSGIAMSAFFLAVILAQSVPILAQDPCSIAGSLRI